MVRVLFYYLLASSVSIKKSVLLISVQLYKICLSLEADRIFSLCLIFLIFHNDILWYESVFIHCAGLLEFFGER